jgi:hypothetical protein
MVASSISDRVNDIVSRIKEFEDLDKDDVLKDLERLQEDSQIGFERAVKEIATRLGVNITPTRRHIQKQNVLRILRKSRESIKRDPEIIENAKFSLENEVAFSVLYNTWTKMHYGDECLGKALIASIACGLNKKSKGIHICVVGPSGCGKSDAQDCAIKLMPEEYRFDGKITPQALYYAGHSIHPGTVISIDDIRWSDDLGETVKTITSVYQKASKKMSVNDGVGSLEEAADRLTFWVSQVDMQADEQIRDRFIIVEVESGEERINEVKSFMNAKYMGEGLKPGHLEADIEFCKEIVRAIRESGPFDVVIPFADKIHVPGDLRAHAMFVDLVQAFTIFRFPIRQKDEFRRLIATESDFNDAKEIFDGIGGISRDKLSDKERKILQAIIDHGYEATYSAIHELTGIPDITIRKTVGGRNNKNNQEVYGLLAKCKDLKVGEEYPTTLKLPNGYNLVNDGVGVYLEGYELGVYLVYIEFIFQEQ